MRKSKDGKRGNKRLIVACACMLLLTGCGGQAPSGGQVPASVEAEDIVREEHIKVPESEESKEKAENNGEYTINDVDFLLGEADAQGSVEEITEYGCLFEPYTVLEDSSIMVSSSEGEEENLEEVAVDENTEYILVKIDAGAGKAVSIERSDKEMLREAKSIYLYGEKDSESVWRAKKIVMIT